MKGFCKRIFVMLATVAILCSCMPMMAGAAVELPTPKFSMNDVMDDLDVIGSGYTEATVDGVSGIQMDGTGSAVYDSLNFDFSKPFTATMSVKKGGYSSGFAVLFALGDKVSGHIEIYLQDGVVHMYAPDVQNAQPIFSHVNVLDGNMHNIAVSYDGATFRYYDNGVKINEWPVSGTVAQSDFTTLSIGSQNDGSMALDGFIGDLRIYDSILTDEQVAEIGKSDTEDDENIVVKTEPQLLVSLIEDGMDIDAGVAEGNFIDVFEHNVGSNFTISAEFTALSQNAIQVMFAKGIKTVGHFEVYIDNGELAFYAPEIAGGNPVKSGKVVTDGQKHAFAITYDGAKMSFYVDGVMTNSYEVTGAITHKTYSFAIGKLVEGGFEFTGNIKDIKIYNYAVSEADAVSLSTIAGAATSTPSDDPTQTPGAPSTGDGEFFMSIAAIVIVSLAAIVLLKRRVRE